MTARRSPQFELNISPRWSSGQKNARQQIRKSLYKRTGNPETLSSSNYHQSGAQYFSISHTKGLGGYILAPIPSGFDIEAQNRTLSDRAFRRLTTPKERALGFTPLEAWVAKEAAYKALSVVAPLQTITEVKLTRRLQKKGRAIVEYSFKHNKINSLKFSGQGFLMPYKRFLLGFAHILP